MNPRPGQGACQTDGTWSFGDPLNPTNHTEFLAHATSLDFRPIGGGAAQKSLPVAVPRPDGSVRASDIITGADGVEGTIRPRIGIQGVRPEVYAPDHRPCAGRVIGRVEIDGRESGNDSLRAEAEWARALQGDGRPLPEHLALLGGYKSFVHEHGSDHPDDPGATHPHRYLPEGVSYIWVDSIRTRNDGSMIGRAVVVSEHTNVEPWALTLRYCPHGNTAAPGCQLAHFGHGATNIPFARWLDIPEDDHTWEWCSQAGCCVVESGPSFRF